MNLVYQTEDSDFNTEESNARPVMRNWDFCTVLFEWEGEFCTSVHKVYKCTKVICQTKAKSDNHIIGDMKLVWQFV